MKQLTPEFFLRASFDKNIKPFGGGIDFDEAGENNGYAWIFEAMQAYAEHLEQSAWIDDTPENKPPFYEEVIVERENGAVCVSSWVNSPDRDAPYWVKIADKITRWRSLPSPPKNTAQ